jgi:hypothetical protein
MRPLSSIFARVAAPRGCLGMLVLVAAVETQLAHHELDITNTGAAILRYAGWAARREAVKCEILCLGDSLIKFGIVPGVIEERLGRRTYNLAVVGGQAPGSYFLLRQALASGAHPSALLVDFKPNFLAQDPRVSERQWTELVSTWDCCDLAWTSRDAALGGWMLLGRLLPSLNSRFELRANLMGALRGVSASPRPSVLVHWRNQNQNRGALLAARNPANRGEVAPDHTHVYFPDRWSCHPVNAAYLERFMRLAQAHEIPVFWLLPPLVPAVQARREEMGLDLLYTTFVRAVQRRFPNLTIIDGRHSGYEHTVFVDAAHLDRYGAGTLTEGVAGVVQPYLDRGRPTLPRWINLPAYRDSPVDIHGEDLIESHVALNRK